MIEIKINEDVRVGIAPEECYPVCIMSPKGECVCLTFEELVRIAEAVAGYLSAAESPDVWEIASTGYEAPRDPG